LWKSLSSIWKGDIFSLFRFFSLKVFKKKKKKKKKKLRPENYKRKILLSASLLLAEVRKFSTGAGEPKGTYNMPLSLCSGIRVGKPINLNGLAQDGS